jgi:hypothetical protein
MLSRYTTKSPPDVCQYLVDDHGFAIYERNSKPAIFSFRVRVNQTVTNNQRNQTQLHKVNDFDF